MTEGRFSGKVAVVTGGANGIGEGTVRRLHAEGAHVLIGDIRSDAGEALAAELGPKVEFHPTDVSDEESVKGLVTVASGKGHLDLMFNNAAIIGAVGPVDSLALDEIDRTIAINLRGVLLGMKYAAGVMKRQGNGVIISTSSPAAMMGGVGAHVYSAVKAGIIGLSNSVAAELRKFGVRVNTIVPGAVPSRMTAGLIMDNANDLAGARSALEQSCYMDRPLAPEDVAAGVLYLASDEASMVTGVVLPIDAGMTGAGGPAAMTDAKYAGMAQ